MKNLNPSQPAPQSGIYNVTGSRGENLIRPASADEVDELTQLAVRASEHDGYDADVMTRIMGALKIKPTLIAAGLVLVAEDANNAVIGVVSIIPLGPGGLLLLDGIFVEPSFMRQGVGRCLMDAAKDLAQKIYTGCSMVIYANPPSAGFYARLGAIRIGTAPFAFSPDILLPVFAYPLSSVDGIS